MYMKSAKSIINTLLICIRNIVFIFLSLFQEMPLKAIHIYLKGEITRLTLFLHVKWHQGQLMKICMYQKINHPLRVSKTGRGERYGVRESFHCFFWYQQSQHIYLELNWELMHLMFHCLFLVLTVRVSLYPGICIVQMKKKS